MTIGFAGIYHLLWFGLFLPWAAFRSGRKFATQPLPPRPRLFVSVLVQQGAFAALSLLVAWGEHITLFPPWNPRPGDLLVGAGVLTVGFALLGPRWRESVERRERRLHICMPRTLKERWLWAGVSVAAGFGEEVTYRGVMFILLSRLLGGPLPAAIGASIVFGFSHILQGWKNAVIVGAVALVLHGLVICRDRFTSPWGCTRFTIWWRVLPTAGWGNGSAIRRRGSRRLRQAQPARLSSPRFRSLPRGDVRPGAGSHLPAAERTRRRCR